MNRSEITILGLIGIGALCLFCFVNSLESADISPIVTIGTPTTIQSEVEGPLVRPERSLIVSEPSRPATSRSVSLGTDGLLKSSRPGRRVVRSSIPLPETPPSDGFVRTFHENGRIESEGPYRAGEKDGYWVYYFKTGTQELSGTYVSGKAEGTWTAWHENGRVRAVASCREGKAEGQCSFWSADGTLDLDRAGVYQQGELITRR